MSRYLIDDIGKQPAVTLHPSTQVRELAGARNLEGVPVESAGDRVTLEICGLFSFIGAEPNSEWLTAGIAKDEDGFIRTGPELGQNRLLLETMRSRSVRSGRHPAGIHQARSDAGRRGLHGRPPRS